MDSGLIFCTGKGTFKDVLLLSRTWLRLEEAVSPGSAWPRDVEASEDKGIVSTVAGATTLGVFLNLFLLLTPCTQSPNSVGATIHISLTCSSPLFPRPPA